MEFDHLPWGRRLDAVSPNEVRKALRFLGYWLTYKLKDRTESGAFSELVLGEPAVKYFSRRAIMKLWTGDWQWKEDLSLTKQLIRIARSDMSHHVRDWKKAHEPELSAMSNMTDSQLAKMELVNQEFAEDLEGREKTKDMAYEIAEAMVSDDPQLLKYLKAVKELNNYHAIAKRMKMTKAELMEVEKRLLNRLKNVQEVIV